MFDEAARFGDGHESADARRFTAERLARASQALRDSWCAASVKSATLPER
jgi:hypothetical protein